MIKHNSKIGEYEVESYEVVGPATQTRTIGYDVYCQGTEWYVNIVKLSDRKLRIYTKGSWLGIVMGREGILNECIEGAMAYTNHGGDGDICSRVAGRVIAINFYQGSSGDVT